MRARRLCLRDGDEFGVRHRRKHGLRALFGAFRVAVRRETRGRLDETREHRGLCNRDVLCGLAEIFLRRRLDTVSAGTEIDAVQIKLQNFSFGMLALQPQREFDLLQFARHGALLRQKKILGELLRQGRTALRHAAMQNVGDCRARDAQRIDAMMRIEPAILDGDEGLRQIGRQIFQRNIGAGHFAACRQNAAVEADDLNCRRTLWNFKRLNCRQMRADPDGDADRRDYRPKTKNGAPIRQTKQAGTSRALALFFLVLRRTPDGRSRDGRESALAASFFGCASFAAMRSFGLSRKLASDAASPNCGSRRPPLFFRPHAILRTPTPTGAGDYRARFKGGLSDS